MGEGGRDGRRDGGREGERERESTQYTCITLIIQVYFLSSFYY